MYFKKILILFLSIIIFSIPVYSEYVFLKDGGILEGKIISDAPGSVTIRLKDKKIKQVPRDNIMRILYTELYMGKVYVQRTDGKNVVCYMVDEDRESYTFRKELFNPEEFTIKRDQVLFMARGNPSGLEGEADYYKVELKWFPPYNPVKYYRIYLKGEADKEFRVADESRSKSAALKELKSNTKYLIYVTAIDAAGDESLPSNELAISTKNIPPDKPVIDTSEKLKDGGYKITWKESSDPDGKVTGYRLYRYSDGKTVILAETVKTEYTLSKDLSEARIFITALDDIKNESEQTIIYLGYNHESGFSISPAYLLPAGKLNKLAENGYGAVLKFELSNFIQPDMELTAEISFFNLSPTKKTYIEPESRINSIRFAPFMLTTGYSFHPFEHFEVIPNISAGGILVQYDYNYFDIPTSAKKNISEFELDPVFGFGINFRYSFNDLFYISMSPGYRIFFEESGTFNYFTGSFGAGIWF